MNVYIIKSEQPNCSKCGIPMTSWNPFATEHTHYECLLLIYDDFFDGILKRQVLNRLQYAKEELKEINIKRLENGFPAMGTTNDIIILEKLLDKITK